MNNVCISADREKSIVPLLISLALFVIVILLLKPVVTKVVPEIESVTPELTVIWASVPSTLIAPTSVSELTVTDMPAGIKALSVLPGTPEGDQFEAVCQSPSVPVNVRSVAKTLKEVEQRTIKKIKNRFFFMVK